eukprot:2357886-Rhodomonas_salina.1
MGGKVGSQSHGVSSLAMVSTVQATNQLASWTVSSSGGLMGSAEYSRGPGVGWTGCEATEWVSGTAQGCKLGSGAGWTLRVGDDARASRITDGRCRTRLGTDSESVWFSNQAVASVHWQIGQRPVATEQRQALSRFPVPHSALRRRQIATGPRAEPSLRGTAHASAD